MPQTKTNVKGPTELDKKAAKNLDSLISIYFQWAGTDKLEPGQTLGQFLVSCAPIYSQNLLNWMEAID